MNRIYRKVYGTQTQKPLIRSQKATLPCEFCKSCKSCQDKGKSLFIVRKIIVYIATSADGYIARPDGDVAWLERPRIKGNYGMGEFFRSIDTILWGRKTIDVALKMPGGISGGYGLKVKHYGFSRRPPKSDPPGVEFV